ncbi:MAG: hypothetical protein ACP5EN_17465 [Rhodovulum sp.]
MRPLALLLATLCWAVPASADPPRPDGLWKEPLLLSPLDNRPKVAPPPDSIAPALPTRKLDCGKHAGWLVENVPDLSESMGIESAAAYLGKSDGDLVTAALFAYAMERVNEGDRSEVVLRTLMATEVMLRRPCFERDPLNRFLPENARMREFASDYPAKRRKRLADWARKELGGLE